VVAAELGVGTLERRVTVSCGLLDTVERQAVSNYGPNCSSFRVHMVYRLDGAFCSRGREAEGAYPFLWFFFD
jgi:hypothetical protein